MRRTSRTLPVLLSGSDFIFSGFGSVQRYDNMFGPSNFNAERPRRLPRPAARLGCRWWPAVGRPDRRWSAMRRQAAEATRAVFEYLGLADFDDEHVEAVVGAAGSKDLPQTDGVKVLSAARMIEQSGLTVLDVVGALAETGFDDIADRVLGMASGPGRRRLPADRRDLRRGDERAVGVDGSRTTTAGPARATGRRRSVQAQIDAVRQARSVTDLVREQATFAEPDRW